MAAAAHAHFDAAYAAMRSCDRRAMRPARLMAATYAALLEGLEARGWQDLTHRVRVPKWRKLWIAARHLA
jgi:phytoene synthase